MQRKVSLLFLGLITLIFIGLISWQYWRVKDLVYELQFKWFSQEESVESYSQVKEIINKFERIQYRKLPQEYKSSTESDQAPFVKMLSGQVYYRVVGKDIYKKIIGDYRIKDFLPKDDHYKQHVNEINESEGVYWLIDLKLLKKCLELQTWLKENNYNKSGYIIVNGYRPPKYNKAIGGASRSRHIFGQAIDILIQDIDNDGKVTQEDKQIVLEVLDREIIGNAGGLGRYPGTMSVHFDVRGRRARWDRK